MTYTAQFAETVNKYTVTWMNGSTEIYREDVEYGTVPSYDIATYGAPETSNTAQYSYAFTGWNPHISSVTSNVIYTAQFSEISNNYTVIWQNYDGTVLETDTGIDYGTTPEYNGTIPVKPETAQYTYTFTGWAPQVAYVIGDVTYIAQFSEKVKEYTVTWQNYDGTVLSVDTLEYGALPKYLGGVPYKTGDGLYSYTFSGWTPSVVNVSENVTYTAVFERADNVYEIIWKNYDGEILEVDKASYGVHPEYNGAVPVKPSDAQYEYKFSGWSPEITAVTESVTYTAQFTEDTAKYTVIWKNYDGTVLRTDTFGYGELPSYGETPIRANTDKYTYSFSGWSPSIAEVKENSVYTAIFDEILNTYTVVWKDGDDVLQTDTLAYGETPVYRGSTEKAATKEKTFEFVGWSPSVTEVTADAVYNAIYKESTVYYTVTWQIGNAVLSDRYEYMQTPTVPDNPGRYLGEDEKTFANFVGWDKKVGPVTDNIVYKATFSADIFDLSDGEKESVLLIPSKNVYTVATEKYDLPIGLSRLASIATENEKDLLIEYENGVQVYFQSSLAREIKEKNLHVSLQIGNTVQNVRLLSTTRSLDAASGEDTVFGGRVILTDGEGNEVTLTGWQLRVPIENGNMSGLSGFSVKGEKESAYKLAQSGNYAVFVSDGSYEFKLIRKLSIRVDSNGGGNVSFGDSEIKAGDTVKADIKPAIGYETESVEVYYEKDGEKISVDFDAEENTFVMPECNAIFSVKFRKLVFTVNFYVDEELYYTAVYGYGDDLVLPENPVKAAEDDSVYDFSGWTPDVSAKVFESVDYHAKFNVSTVADDDHGKTDHGFNFPYMLFIISVLFFGGVGTGTYFIVRAVKKKNKKAE